MPSALALLKFKKNPWVKTRAFQDFLVEHSTYFSSYFAIINFPHSKYSGAFWLVLVTVLKFQGCFCSCWAALAESQGLFCSTPHPTSEETGGTQEVGTGHRQDGWSQLTTGMSHPIWYHAQHIELGEEGQGDVQSDGICIPKSSLCVMEPGCPGDAEHFPTHGNWCMNSLVWCSHVHSFCFAC